MDIPKEKWLNYIVFANSWDPDQTPRSAASDLGLHCLPVTRLGVSSLQWVNDVIRIPDRIHQTQRRCIVWFVIV